MQKEGGRSPASGCVDDACSIRLARKPGTMPLLPLFTLPHPSENYESPQNCLELPSECCGVPPARTKGHRPWKQAYRPKMVSSAGHCWPVGTRDGRSAIYSCRILQLTAAEGKQCMAWNFQANVCMATLPIMLWIQGSVALGTRATNHAFQCMMA